jgi:DNA-binding CsgD family transcriptional regulator
MNQFDVVQGFLELGESGSPTLERLAAEFLKVAQALGFPICACCSHVDPHHPPPEAVMIHNYPGGWVRAYSEAKLHEIDPVLKRAERSAVPFFWDSALRCAPVTRSQEEMMADAIGYGITHGYTVPLRLSWLPGSLRASCTVIPDRGPIEVPNYFALEVAAGYLHYRTSRAYDPWLNPICVDLTPRECECLTLVAQGKDDWTIGRLLGLGKSTVHYHIEQLKQRLRVATRPQAVVHALMNGQISFGDVVRRFPHTPFARMKPHPPTHVGSE